MKIQIFILITLLTAALSHAEVYKWVDEKGSVHFTDDMTQVPEKYRRGIQEVGVDEEKVIATKEESQSPPTRQTDLPKDRLGRGEDYWRGRVEEWRQKLQSLQEKLEGLRVKYNEFTEKFNASKSSVERALIRNDREQIRSEMEVLKVQIAEAKEMLEKKIPEEASLYKARPEWVKP
ncbi:MAG: DUF4124 domain-containing protein [Thermodesulfobacteriota bacterium]